MQTLTQLSIPKKFLFGNFSANPTLYSPIPQPNSNTKGFSFLKKLGQNKRLVFLPKTPETLSRIAVEARMMGMSVIVNKMIGATREPWYAQKGVELIQTFKQKRQDIKNIVVGAL